LIDGGSPFFFRLNVLLNILGGHYLPRGQMNRFFGWSGIVTVATPAIAGGRGFSFFGFLAVSISLDFLVVNVLLDFLSHVFSI
jgi:hypothetical protein